MLGVFFTPGICVLERVSIMGTVLVLAVLVVIVGLIVWGMVKDRKQGKSSCGGDCANCHGKCH